MIRRRLVYDRVKGADKEVLAPATPGKALVIEG